MELGRVDDGLRVIAAGLLPDDRVVVGGLKRARQQKTVKFVEVDMSRFVKSAKGPTTTSEPPAAREADAVPVADPADETQ